MFSSRHAFALHCCTPRDTIELTLRNNGLEAVRYNLCGFVFSPKLEEPLRACAAVAEGLPGGTSVVGQKEIPATAASGWYALELTVERVANGERLLIDSAPFEITP